MDEITLNKDRQPHLCDCCERGRNCINGRWCQVTRKYMEHHNLWLCDNYCPSLPADGDEKKTSVSQDKERNENDGNEQN